MSEFKNAPLFESTRFKHGDMIVFENLKLFEWLKLEMGLSDKETKALVSTRANRSYRVISHFNSELKNIKVCNSDGDMYTYPAELFRLSTEDLPDDLPPGIGKSITPETKLTFNEWWDYVRKSVEENLKNKSQWDR